MIRHATLEDARQITALMEKVENTSSYMLHEVGERNLTVEGWLSRLKQIETEKNSAVLLAEKSNQLIGYLIAIGGRARRKAHSAYLVIGIHPDFRGQGIGTALFKELDNWARKQYIHRLELTVVVENVAGIALYQKAGFEIEGLKKDALKIGDAFVDEYYMAKLI